MRFWLRWAIVTLPVVALVLLWVQSYWYQANFMRYGRFLNFNCRFDYGSLMIVVVRGQPLREGWAYKRFPADKDSIALTAHHFLGFGYARNLGNPLPIQTIVVMPMWFVTVLVAIPPLWLHRQRKRRTTGFPVGPLDSETTSSA